MINPRHPLTGVYILIAEDAVELSHTVSNGLRWMGAVVELQASARQTHKRLL
jgi:hypothetical protein